MLNLLIETIFIVTPLAVCVLTPLIMWGLIALHKKVVKKQNAKIDYSSFTVKYNSLAIGAVIFLVVFMAVCAVLFPILYLCDIPDGPPLDVVIGVTFVFGTFTVLSGLFLFAFKRWQVEVRDDGVSVTPLLGKRRVYRWEDLSCVRCNEIYGNINYKVYLKATGKKTFTFNALMVGGKMLEEKLREKGLLRG